MREFQVGTRVVGTRGENYLRRMVIADVVTSSRGGVTYVMDNGAFLAREEIAAAWIY